MRIKRLPAGFVVPAQPIKASKPPSGADWVHEIKHDGYRLIVRRDGPTVRLYTRNAYDWTVRLPAIAAAAARIQARSFTIDGEAVVLGPDGLSRFVELRRREAAHGALLYAFALIEQTARICATAHLSTARPRWRDCCEIPRPGILLNDHVAEDGPPCSLMLAGLAPRASSPSRRHLSVWSVPGLDQGPESHQHCGAAGA